MKNATKTIFAAVCLLGAATPVLAQEASWALNGSLAVQSDYRFRGLSQSDRDPVPQGGLTLSGPDGWYVGTWASKIDWDLYGANNNPGYEVDLFAGKNFDLGGANLNVQAYYYAYPDAQVPAGTPEASFFEGIFQLSRAFGPVSLMGTFAISPEFSLGGGTSTYFAGNAVITINDWLTASGNVGHQSVNLAPTSYTHGDIGLTASFNGFSLDARYVTTDLNAANCGFYMGTRNACSGGFVGTLSYSFAIAP